jgi:hypothetical protein
MTGDTSEKRIPREVIALAIVTVGHAVLVYSLYKYGFSTNWLFVLAACIEVSGLAYYLQLWPSNLRGDSSA